MGLEKVISSKQDADLAWKRLVEHNIVTRHFNGNPPGDKPFYDLKRLGTGSITISCSHPDIYGNRFHESKETIGGADIIKIFIENPKLADHFFELYRLMLLTRHEEALKKVTECKVKALAEIEQAVA